MTHTKLAKLAGVSPATVSKVISGSNEISKETAEKVFKVAAENGLNLQKQRRVKLNFDKLRVDIIVPEIVSVYYSSMATKAAEILEKSNIIPTVHICGFNTEKIKEKIELLIDSGISDGIISFNQIELQRKPNIPVICFCEKELKHCDTVATNTYSGIDLSIKHLKELGHKNIGFIGETFTTAKENLFRKAMKNNALPINEKYIFKSQKRFEEIGYEAVNYYKSNNCFPTAIITAYDEIALGAIHELKIHTITVPQDISVIGFNNITFSAYSSVPLTTVSSYTNEQIEMAIDILKEKISNNNSGIFRHISVQSELIIRNTTAKAKDE